MKNLPIGIQTFSDFPDFDFVYVDKTELIHKMVTTGKYYFLSRPRRFGKSLLVSTMKELFQGNKILFKGLWIENNWDWSKKFPVVHFSFDAMAYKTIGLEAAISLRLNEIAEDFEVVLNSTNYQTQFEELIKKVSKKHGKVAVLIDEYDKPIIDYLEYEESGIYTQAKLNQEIMRNFYSILKNAGEYLRFLFVTGISKFSKVSMFSDLNHLKDITIHPAYSTIVGYTQDELEHYFGDYIDEVAEKLKMERIVLLENIRLWYNGFSWDGKTKVYNPFGLLNFLEQTSFRNYWFSTGTPTFLLYLMKKKGVFDVENISINPIVLDKYDIDNLDLGPLLFQAGYLTIKEIDGVLGDMVLDYPNKEVRESMYRFMINKLTQSIVQ